MGRLSTLKPRVQSAARSLATLTPGSWRDGKTTTERGYGYRWQQARVRFLSEHPLCCYCEARRLVVAATVVDHKVPHRGDDRLFWDRDNWQPLCKACHDGQKAREERVARGHG